MKTPIRALELTQILGQPCEFQVEGDGAVNRANDAALSATVPVVTGREDPGGPPGGESSRSASLPSIARGAKFDAISPASFMRAACEPSTDCARGSAGRQTGCA